MTLLKNSYRSLADISSLRDWENYRVQVRGDIMATLQAGVNENLISKPKMALTKLILDNALAPGNASQNLGTFFPCPAKELFCLGKDPFFIWYVAYLR